MSNLYFWSGKNYMKRDATTGSQPVAAPVTLAYGQYVTQTVITHDLGIIPFFRIFYEPFKDGVIWEALGTRNQQFATNPRNQAGVTGPYLIGFPETTTLTIELGYSSNTLTGTYPIYYVIYKDYGIA